MDVHNNKEQTGDVEEDDIECQDLHESLDDEEAAAFTDGRSSVGEGTGRKRRYGDTVGIDWDDPIIVQLIEDYLTKRIRSLELLCWRILEYTGVAVSKMTLSRRLNGKSFYAVIKKEEPAEVTTVPLEPQIVKPEPVPERRSERISKKSYHFASLLGCKKKRVSEVKSEPVEPLTTEDLWDSPPVKSSVNAFARGEIATLADLQTQISDCVGLKVPLSVLTSKLKELGLLTVAVTKNATYGNKLDMPATSSAGNPVRTLVLRSSDDVICGTAASEPSLGGMSRCLHSTVLSIPVGGGMLRQYMQNKTGHEKQDVKYFRCSHCATIHRRMRTNILPKIKVVDGAIIGDRYPMHHPLCKPISRAEAIVREIDRNCRREIRLGIASPKDAWNAGRWRAIQEAEKLRASSNGVLNAFDDVAAAFPPWKKVRSQYLRLSLLAKTVPKDHVVTYDGLTAMSDGEEEDYSVSLDEMATSYNRTSSYNRTYEKRIIEDGSPHVRLESPLRMGSPLHLASMQAPSLTTAPLTSGSGFVTSQHTSEDAFYAQLDVSQFKPEDLKVSVIGTFIVVDAHHPEREDELGFIERHFIRKFRLPPSIRAEAVTSNLSADGQLSISATAPKQRSDGTTRTVPITLVPAGGKSESPRQAAGTSGEFTG